MSKPESTFTEELHRHVWEESKSEIILERFSEDRQGGLRAEMTIRTNMPPKPGLLYRGRVNLLAERTIKTIANNLEERTEFVDWWDHLTAAFWLSLEYYRNGNPPLPLADMEPNPNRGRYIMKPIFDGEGPTVYAGAGGDGKSVMAIAQGISIASGYPILGIEPEITGPFLYLDWESDHNTHRERLEAICRTAGIDPPKNLFYRREVAALRETAPALRQHIRKIGAVAAGLDSIGLARGGAPESAEDTLALFAAIRRLDVPVLAIDHKTKATIDAKKTGIFGSVYTHNSARMIWEVIKAQHEDEDHIAVAIQNTKNNNGPKWGQRGWRIEFQNKGDTLDRITFTRTNVEDILDLADRLPVWMQIKHVLNSGPADTQEIADELDINIETIRKTLKRYPDRFIRLPGKRPQKWGVLGVGTL